MIDQRLVRAINRGRCFALVGSGPSCELGYPSWKKLAEETYKKVSAANNDADDASYEKLLREGKYPELFRQAEIDLGSRDELVNVLRTSMSPSEQGQGFLYKTIANWPFACYLTTNYDDELANHLNQLGEHFSVIRNRKEDFHSLRDGATHLIQKLHSDLDHPDEVTITSEDYRRLYINPEGDYFQTKLRQVLEMFDVFIIGHSLSDPDIDHILQMARTTASPKHPIYMMASGFTKAEEREYLEKYNIVLVQYKNEDGKHTHLRRLLATADRFIVPRHKRITLSRDHHHTTEEVEAAIALFLFRRLQGADSTASMEPVILSAVASKGTSGLTFDEVIAFPLLDSLSNGTPAFRDSVQTTLKNLEQNGFVQRNDEKYVTSEAGRERVDQLRAIQDTEKDQAYGQFRISLERGCPDVTNQQCQQCAKLAEDVIVSCFASRGLTLANQVFGGQTPGPEELSDIFKYVADVATEISTADLRAAFVEAMHRFLIEPSTPQKNYLASMSQGYFLYHHLGCDPTCAKVRRDIFQQTLWLCDASVLLPFVAVGCNNHEYSVEMFRMLSAARAAVYTTPSLLQEAWEHFQWAMNFVRAHGVDSPDFLNATLVKGSHKQNLFLDGFVRLSSEGKVGTFSDYLDLVSPDGLNRSAFERHITDTGVVVLTPSSIEGFAQDDWERIEEAKAKIQEERQERGTFRGPLQVESEAQIWVLINNIRTGKYSLSGVEASPDKVYFVSQSKILDIVFQSNGATTWRPEAVYRYLSVLPGNEVDPDVLQQCMTHEYFYAGVSFIDKPRYLRYFGPSVDAAKASFEQEKSRYIRSVEEEHTRAIDEAFERTPDLEKPFFVAQMGWRVAEASQRAEEIAKNRAAEAGARVKQLESEKDAAWRLKEKRRRESEDGRMRNLQDPKKLRKRERQKKRRSRKKKRR